MTSAINIMQRWISRGLEFIECGICLANGVCSTCKGCGLSGYFLSLPPRTAPPCRRCAGSGKCHTVQGNALYLRSSRTSR
jgi:hypothetical protein